MKQSKIQEVFPFDSFRDKQFDLVVEVLHKLYKEDYDNVIIDAPTGVGKSAVNVTASQLAESSFYVTPQKKLREQLQEDDVLSEYYEALRGREDYVCGETGQDCSSCPINQESDQSCMEMEQCTYWNHKTETMAADVAVLTFAYLIIDGAIPQFSGPEGNQISFGDRELLIVDECHNLEDQAASLFAGFKVSPYSLPMEVFDNITHKLDLEDTTRHHQVMDIVETLEDRAEDFVATKQMQDGELSNEEAVAVEKCERFLNKIEWFFDEIEYGRDWVVDMDVVEFGRSKYKAFKLKPVKVDKFLRNFVWNRADKRVLSTATMPYRDNPGRWMAQIGLPGETHVIRVGMPFDKGHRPVFTDRMVANMSRGGIDRNWDAVMEEINSLAGQYNNKKGLIHCASYSRGEDFWQDAQNYSNLKGNVKFDRPEENTDSEMWDWQDGTEDIFVSPAVTEGVDLEGDKCRWQVLMKVPFPSPGDPRVEYLLDEMPHIGWDWYYETTANAIIQSVGRAVRSKDDYADYYVLDEKFNDVLDRVAMPDWFTEAIDAETTYNETNALSW